MTEPQESRALQLLLAAAALVVVVAGLKAAGDILLPILFAAFLAALAWPVVRTLQRLGLPTVIGIPLVVLLVAAALVGVTGLVAGTVRGFTQDVTRYEPEFQQLVGEGLRLSKRFGIQLQQSDLTDMLQPGIIMGLVGQTLNALVALLSRLVIVVVTMTFILFEASELALKVRVAFGTEALPAGPFGEIAGTVQRYLVIKTLASAVTGVAVMGGTQLLGLDFPVLWGLLAFAFNYVPSVGSIVAAVPPLLLAMVQLGPARALLVGALFLTVNITIGNFAEPRFMGRSMGLSPLVVFLSLMFWGWVWGPVGMLLCVPVTVIGKIVLESYPDTRNIAVLLGSHRDALDRAEEQAGRTPSA